MSGVDVDSHTTMLCDLALDTVDTAAFRVYDGKLYVFKGGAAISLMERGDGIATNAANAAANYARLGVDETFVNSNSADCQAQVLANWRDIASASA